jgi:hypothetical protein
MEIHNLRMAHHELISINVPCANNLFPDAILHGVSRDQLMAQHKANHIQVVYADTAELANKANTFLNFSCEYEYFYLKNVGVEGEGCHVDQHGNKSTRVWRCGDLIDKMMVMYS